MPITPNDRHIILKGPIDRIVNDITGLRYFIIRAKPENFNEDVTAYIHVDDSVKENSQQWCYLDKIVIAEVTVINWERLPDGRLRARCISHNVQADAQPRILGLEGGTDD